MGKNPDDGPKCLCGEPVLEGEFTCGRATCRFLFDGELGHVPSGILFDLGIRDLRAREPSELVQARQAALQKFERLERELKNAYDELYSFVGARPFEYRGKKVRLGTMMFAGHVWTSTWSGRLLRAGRTWGKPFGTEMSSSTTSTRRFVNH